MPHSGYKQSKDEQQDQITSVYYGRPKELDQSDLCLFGLEPWSDLKPPSPAPELLHQHAQHQPIMPSEEDAALFNQSIQVAILVALISLVFLWIAFTK